MKRQPAPSQLWDSGCEALRHLPTSASRWTGATASQGRGLGGVRNERTHSPGPLSVFSVVPGMLVPRQAELRYSLGIPWVFSLLGDAMWFKEKHMGAWVPSCQGVGL